MSLFSTLHCIFDASEGLARITIDLSPTRAFLKKFPMLEALSVKACEKLRADDIRVLNAVCSIASSMISSHSESRKNCSHKDRNIRQPQIRG